MEKKKSKLENENWKMKPPKVAIVCDWLTGIGGAERVVLELHNLYPDAPIYTSQYNPNKIDWFQGADVRTGWIQKLPPSLKKFLPVFRAWYFSRLDLSEYDVVISSSGAEAKGVNIGKSGIVDGRWAKLKKIPGSPATSHQPPTTNPVHISYIHSPTHYYWVRYDDYLKNPGFGRLDFLARIGLKILVGPLRKWDYHAAQKPDFIIANSTHTQAMIQKFYNRESTVIHPPVDTDRFKLPGLHPVLDAVGMQGGAEQRTESYEEYGERAAEATTKQAPARSSSAASLASRQAGPFERRGFVAAGRQTPYKRIDLAVQACSELGLPLVVIGSGPEHRKLKRMAGKSVTFLRGKSDDEVAHYFQTSLAFIFPGMDDFGIVAVEAMAAGTPVIAYKAGGALDYVEQGKTGLFFEKQTVESLKKALDSFSSMSFNNNQIQKQAEKFSIQNFQDRIAKFVNSKASSKDD